MIKESYYFGEDGEDEEEGSGKTGGGHYRAFSGCTWCGYTRISVANCSRMCA